MTQKKRAGAPKKMQAPGHYKRPMIRLPGMSTMNMPNRGRVGKLIPQLKKFKRG